MIGGPIVTNDTRHNVWRFRYNARLIVVRIDSFETCSPSISMRMRKINSLQKLVEDEQNAGNIVSVTF